MAFLPDCYPEFPAMGRAPNKSKPVDFQISVPAETNEYLEYMAENGILGVNRSEIASHIVVREINKMKESGYFAIAVPRK